MVIFCNSRQPDQLTLALEWIQWTPEDGRRRAERPKGLVGKIHWMIWTRWVWTEVMQHHARDCPPSMMTWPPQLRSPQYIHIWTMPICFFLPQTSTKAQTPALSENGHPSHLIIVTSSFCSIHHGSVSLAPNQLWHWLQNCYSYLQYFVFWPSGIPSRTNLFLPTFTFIAIQQ